MPGAARSSALSCAAGRGPPAVPDRKATAEAVEAVHSQYEKVEGLLR